MANGSIQNGLSSLGLKIGGSGTIPSGQSIEIWGAQMVMGSSQGTYTGTSTTSNGGSTLSANGMNQSYAYDAFGNMISSGNFNFVQAYTTSNQLSGWSYDASGNLLNDGLGNTYTYDAESRISAVSGYSYVYDAEGNRLEKSGSAATDYIYFGGRQLARLAGGQWTDLVYGVSGLLAEVPGTQNGVPVYRMLDHLGTQVGTVTYNGQLLSITDYAPFGQIFGGGSSDPYQFTGKERDSESGNDYFGARYYSSSMGRFMSPDWSAQEDPVPYAQLDDPQSLNLYSYVFNNPLSRVDLDGHDGCCDPVGIVEDAIEDFAISHPDAVDAVVGPLINSAEGALETGADVSLNAVVGVGGFFLLNPTMASSPAELAWERQNRIQQQLAYNRAHAPNPNAAHRNNKRKSTKGPHQKGERRLKKDQGGEKADWANGGNRRRPRKPPNDWRGPWPPMPEPDPPPPPPKRDPEKLPPVGPEPQ